MWLKNGVQACSRCGGQGCWHCQRKGIVVLCPGCACQEMEMLHKIDGDTYHCDVCGAEFSRSGEIKMFEDTESKPKGKKWDRSKGVKPKG